MVPSNIIGLAKGYCKTNITHINIPDVVETVGVASGIVVGGFSNRTQITPWI